MYTPNITKDAINNVAKAVCVHNRSGLIKSACYQMNFLLQKASNALALQRLRNQGLDFNIMYAKIML